MQVNVNRNSWHYKLAVKPWSMNVPKSLCGYFWRVVLTLFLIAFFSSIFIGAGVVMPAHSIYILATVDNLTNAQIGDVIAGLIVWELIAFFLLIGIPFYLFNKHKDSLLIQYLTAVKNKVCPLIEYTND